MCKDLFTVWAPCGHWDFTALLKCRNAKGIRNRVKNRLLKSKCQPENMIKFIIDWCPECRAGFSDVVENLGAAVPAEFRSFWAQRLMERYWAIKSQHRWFYAVEPGEIAYEAFSGNEPIEYVPSTVGNPNALNEVCWEEYVLENEIRRLHPVKVWIQGYHYAPAEDKDAMFRLCKKAIYETMEKAKASSNVKY
ncbi:hypothetical protein F66182_5678 [Fusarium sp. NRRL 66182]|nr:hypothetical protein F66182_5678 [Fusarium sp. NRRL 66182]